MDQQRDTADRFLPRFDAAGLVTAIVTDRMAHAADLSVPLDVQVGSGANWDDAAH